MPRPAARITLAVVFLFIAASVFAARTVLKPGPWLWDFAIYSSSSRVYLSGGNPYDHDAVRAAWDAQSKSESGSVQSIDWLDAIVPPQTLLLLSPVSALPRSISFPVWFALSFTLMAAAGFALIELAGLQLAGARAWALLGGCLLLGPVQSVLHTGQPAGPASAMIILAIWAVKRRRNYLAAVLLALASATKMQLGLPFMVLFALYRPTRVASIGGALGLILIAIVSIAPLQLRGIPWFQDWTHNVRESTTNGRTNDFVIENPTRDHLINLQMPVYALSRNRGVSNATALGIAGALGLVWLVTAMKKRDAIAPMETREPERRQPYPLLLPAAALSAIILLPVYHRYYDASLLALAMAWAAAVWPRRRMAAIVVLALLVPFCLPVGWQTIVSRRMAINASVTGSTLWLAGVAAIQSWLTLLLGIVLVLLMTQPGPDRTLQSDDIAPD